ncbi:MAG TPA: hypothetical protein VNW30_10745 [Opitutaceae bacterium]|jgi:hypothetical protein|nr:hypothetical protein [Opitutaceae bacterium]
MNRADAPLTPKEFADEVFGGKRCAKWVRYQCALYVKTSGKRGIPVLGKKPPYLIPATARGLFMQPLFLKRALQVA